MENVIINAHVADSRNIGDLASAPSQYFDFKCRVETIDLRSLDPNFSEPKSGFGGSITLDEIQKSSDRIKYHLIVGGGGLLFKPFLGSFHVLEKLKSVFTGKWIAWGVGQQIYPNSGASQGTVWERLQSARDTFNYTEYLKCFDQVGIRDIDFGYPWLPCASCMHPTFDKKRQIKHDFVVFSHRKFQIKMGRFPRMNHDTQSLEEVIDFLGSGETIITSSYHGAYWGTLLGRRVLAFPFSTKFLTLKHPPSLYPVSQWHYSKVRFKPFKKTFLNKINLEFCYGDYYTCHTKNWRNELKKGSTNPDILQEYRNANIQFHKDTIGLLGN